MLTIEHLETFGDNTMDFDLDVIGNIFSEETIVPCLHMAEEPFIHKGFDNLHSISQSYYLIKGPEFFSDFIMLEHALKAVTGFCDGRNRESKHIQALIEFIVRRTRDSAHEDFLG